MHLGFHLGSGDEVRTALDRVRADGVEIIEHDDDADRGVVQVRGSGRPPDRGLLGSVTIGCQREQAGAQEADDLCRVGGGEVVVLDQMA
jgi:hypothetical protein